MYRRLQRAAVITMGVVAAAACSSDTSSRSDDEPATPSPQPVTIAVPAAFTPESTWNVPLPNSVVAHRLALEQDTFVYLAGGPTGYTLGSVELPSGETKLSDVPLDAVEDPDQRPVLRIVDTSVVAVFQQGTIDHDDGPTSGYMVSTVDLDTGELLTQTTRQEATGTDSAVVSSQGLVIHTRTTSDRELVDVAAATATGDLQQGGDTVVETICQDSGCTLSAHIIEKVGDLDVYTFSQSAYEARDGGEYRICSRTGADAAGNEWPTCTEGFTAQGWDSAQDPPDSYQGVPSTLAGTVNGLLLGSWQPPDENTSGLGVIDPAQGSTLAATTCDHSPSADPVPTAASPNGRYVVSGNAAFNLDTEAGMCVNDIDGEPVSLRTVTNDGTAYGTAGSELAGEQVSAENAVTVNVETNEIESGTVSFHVPLAVYDDGTAVFLSQPDNEGSLQLSGHRSG